MSSAGQQRFKLVDRKDRRKERPAMLRFQVAVLSAFFLYLLTFVSGCPQFVLPNSEPSPFEMPAAKTEDPGNPPPKLAFTWAPGLMERTALQRRALAAFRDPLLESDSRPDRLLRSLERSFTADLVLLLISIVWGILLLTCLAALRRGHWFYRPMLLMVLAPLAVAVLLVLLNVRRFEVIEAQRNHTLFRDWLLLGRVYAEVTLLFSGAALFLSKLLPARVAETPRDLLFMSHLRPDGGAVGRGREGLITAAQIATIIAAALAIANVILFPLYVLQISFPKFFGALLGIVVVGLGFFYTRAYVRVSHAQGATGGPDSAAAFLGFRVLRNTLFVTGAILLVVVTVSVIIVITMLNIDFLQTFELLQRPQRL